MKLIFFTKALKGVLLGAISSLLLLLTFAFIQSKQDNPVSYTALYSWIALGIGALICTRLSVGRSDQRFLQALCASAAFAGLVIAFSAIVSDLTSKTLLKALILAVLSVTGAMIGKRTAKKTSSSKSRKTVIKRFGR